MPVAMTPHRPLTPWTEIAPTGSSTLRRSKNATATQTRTPATAPMKLAAMGPTKPEGAVIATRPASMPLTIMPGFGLPSVHQV